MKKHLSKRLLSLFLAVLMVATSAPLVAYATVESGGGKQTGTSEGQPFTAGNPSDLYRIPNIVTLDDGTLVAMADTRWNGGMDGGGNDSIIAVSDDNGATWDWSLVTYYPDNGDVFNTSSTSVCDSALATDGVNLYTLTTFFPAGVAINESSADNRPVEDNAFDAQGRLMLRRNGESGFNYYLGEFVNGSAQIYSNNGQAVNGYTVDEEYYIYNNGSKAGTVFYSDAEFQTVKTTFLVFRTSSDKGQTWSGMQLLNLKNDDEQFLGVGPGRGIATKDGTIIFGAYQWNEGGILSSADSTQRSCLVYSRDGGKTWKRSADCPGLSLWIPYGDWSSECCPVLLDDGTVRLFMRSARPRFNYIDARLNSNGEYEWVGDPVSLDLSVYGEDFESTPNNQYCVIKYSRKVLYNGNYYTMLIASHANADDRSHGTLTFMLIDSNNNCVAAVQHQINTTFFAYSSLTELPNGQIDLLYEYEAASIRYAHAPDIESISGYRIQGLPHAYDVSMLKNDERTFTVSTNSVEIADPSIVSAECSVVEQGKANMGSDSSYSGLSIPLSDALYSFEQDDNGRWYVSSQGVHLTIDTAGQPSTKDREPINIYSVENGTYFQFIDLANEALYMHTDAGNEGRFDQTTAHGQAGGDLDGRDREYTLFKLFRPLAAGETNTAADPVKGYKAVNQITEGGQYLIGKEISGQWYFLYPSYQPDNVYSHTIRMNSETSADRYNMTVKALARGNTTITAGLDTYNIEVNDYSREITGVVDYDPVIYTHGGEIQLFGQNIADGSELGEKYTDFRLNDTSYTITDITAVEAFGSEEAIASNIKYIDNGDGTGRLTGTLNAASNSDYNAYNSGTYVTLKTTLQDSTGAIWTQSDRLYVASNPVPGHVISGNLVSRYFWGAVETRTVALPTYIMAEGSYGNTTLSRSGTFNNEYAYVGNARILFPENGVMRYNGKYEDIFNAKDNSTEFKGAGVMVHNNGSDDTEIHNLRVQDVNNNITVAYYYYDKSSDHNQGITVDATDSNKFSFNVTREPINIEYSPNSYWNRDIKIGDGNRSYIQKLSGNGEIATEYYQFGGNSSGSESYNSPYDDTEIMNTKRTATVDVTTSVTPNTEQTVRGIVRYQEGAEPSGSNVPKCWNDMKLTFEVIMCDKSEERAPYEAAVSDIKKSTDFTRASWSNYMNALLIRQEYLNNYTLTTTAAQRPWHSKPDEYSTYESYFDHDGADTVDLAERYLQKRANFDDLMNEIANDESIYESGIRLQNGTNYTPESFEKFETAYESAVAFMESVDSSTGEYLYDTEDKRLDVPGYVLTPNLDDETYIDGPAVPTEDAYRTWQQIRIDDLYDTLVASKPVVAADDEVFIAAEEEADMIDLDAYTDGGAAVKQSVADAYFGEGDYIPGDTREYQDIYTLYSKDGSNEQYYVNIPALSQQALDAFTTELLTQMNINVADGAESGNVAKYNVAYSLSLDGEIQDESNTEYHYGEIAQFDLTQYASAEYTIQLSVKRTNDENDKGVTYNVSDLDNILSVMIQEDTTIDVEVFTNEIITVKDYYGTVIGTGYVDPENGTQIYVNGNTITIGDTVITAKESPKFKFTGWSVGDGVYTYKEAATISQYGSLNAGVDKTITVSGGTVNGKESFATPYFNEKLTIEAEQPGSVWVKQINGVDYVASFDSSFVNFTTNEDINYTAYAPGSTQYEQIMRMNNPAVYGSAYLANEKFTISVDYSAPDSVKVVEAGALLTSDSSIIENDGFVKNDSDQNSAVNSLPANRIAHWNDGDTNSGTFTITLNPNGATGPYYLRAYVCYTKDFDAGEDQTNPDITDPGSITAPYVEYASRIFVYRLGSDGKPEVVPVN